MPTNNNNRDTDGITVEQILGDYYRDEPEDAMWMAEEATGAAKADKRPVGKPEADSREDSVPNWRKVPDGLPGKLLACAKSVILFGGLNCLIFYWAQAGLMDSSVAVPSMCACAALAGWGVGKNAHR